MANLKRSMTLSPTSIGKLIDHLEVEYREKRKREILLDFLNEIKDDLVAIIKKNIEKYVESRPEYAGSGQLKEGISYEIDREKLTLTLFTDNYGDDNYAGYVEFGTGLAGAPVPLASKVGWQYNQSGKGLIGWAFQKDGEWFWTYGQQGARFMDFSALDIQSYLDKKYRTYQYKGGAK